jgi:pre-mRNA-splicing factor CDC5/CEF1
MPTPMRTPRTPMGRDTLKEEAQNLIAMTKAQTPLHGGENPTLHPTDFGGITPQNRQIATPNTLSGEGPGNTPSRTPSRTPRGTTPAATPARDGLNINEGMSAEEALQMGSKRSQARKADAFKRKLASGLNALPKATNEYMLVKPEIPPELPDRVEEDADYEEDAEDAVLRIARQAKQQEEAILRKRHTVIQRELPRPNTLNVNMGKDTEGAVHEMLREEMIAMLRYDAYQHPLEPNGKKKKKRSKKERMPKLDMHEEEELLAARDMVADELCKLDNPLSSKFIKKMSENSDSDEEEDTGVSAEFVGKCWSAANDDFMFLPSEKSYGLLSSVSTAEQVQALRQEFSLTRESIITDAKAASKLESKLNVLTVL